MTYEKMTAQELHEIVTRLEAKGFKVPEGIEYLNPLPNTLPRADFWCADGIEFPTPRAAAIIEVAARDWWLGGGGGGPQEMRNLDATYAGAGAISFHADGAQDGEWSALGRGTTPLHAIAAAVEAAK